MAFEWTGFWEHGITQNSEANMNYSLMGVGLKSEFPAASTDFQGATAWASDEQKLYYCTGAAWVAVAPGLNIAQTINGVQTFGSIPVLPAADPTTDNQAVRKASRTVSKVISGSRAYGSGGGAVAITGAGFTPKAVIINAFCNDPGAGSAILMFSAGFSDSAADESCLAWYLSAGVSGSIQTTNIIYCLSTTYGWSGVLTSMDADGCTITLTMGASTTGTLYYEILFLG